MGIILRYLITGVHYSNKRNPNKIPIRTLVGRIKYSESEYVSRI